MPNIQILNGNGEAVTYSDVNEVELPTPEGGTAVFVSKNQSGEGSVPEFDLTAMGLPAVPLTGAAVSVACDTTELRGAMDKGPVKLLLKADTVDGMLPCNAIFNAMLFLNQYQCTFIGLLAGVCMVSIIVTEAGIRASVTVLATPSA